MMECQNIISHSMQIEVEILLPNLIDFSLTSLNQPTPHMKIAYDYLRHEHDQQLKFLVFKFLYIA